MRPGHSVLGRFRIESKAGAGAMGVVYRATDLTTGRAVALKALRGADDEAEKRFLREAEVLASLRHSAIVEYVAHGEADGEPFLAMEWLEGGSLKEVLEERELGFAEIIDVAEAVASALVVAHAQGVIHRDLKPANVFLVQKSPRLTKVVDFGIARLGGKEMLTSSGAMLGTPAYMSPEQVTRARHADARSDLFSLGAVLFRCVSGRAPFQMEESIQTILALSTTRAPAVRTVAPRVPPRLASVIDALLGKEPSERPADASTVLRILADARSDISAAAPTLSSSIASTSAMRPVSPTVAGTTLGKSSGSLGHPLAGGPSIGNGFASRSGPQAPALARSQRLPWILGGALAATVLGGAIALYFAFASTRSLDGNGSSKSSNAVPASANGSSSPTKTVGCTANATECVKLDLSDSRRVGVDELVQKVLDYGQRKVPNASPYQIWVSGITDDGVDLTVHNNGADIRYQDAQLLVYHDHLSYIAAHTVHQAPPPHCSLADSYKRARAYGLPADPATGQATSDEVVFSTHGSPPTTVKLNGATCEPISKTP